MILKICGYFRMGIQITCCKLYRNIELLHVDLLEQVKSICSNAFILLSYVLILIFRWVSKKWDVGAWTGLIWLRIGTDGGNL
jgi:hypothetical protein